MVEQVIKNSEKAITRTKIKQRIPRAIMHQTLNIILDYLEDRGMIADTRKGIVWIYNPSKKLEKEIKKGVEL